MLFARPHRDLAPTRLRPRTLVAHSAGRTDLAPKLDVNDLLVVMVKRRFLFPTLRAGQTCHRLAVPIHPEATQIISLSCARLPATIGRRRPQQIQLILPVALHQPFRVDLAGIQQMLLWQQIALL